MDYEKRNFDKEAATWDENPVRVKLVKNVASAISKQVILKNTMDVMDFGCGTGLLTFQIQPLVHSVTGVDSSQGMLDVYNKRINELRLNNVKALYLDLDRGDTLSGAYDLVMSNTTMHHIRDLKPLFHQFHDIMVPGGCLCIADLDLDDGMFHDDNTGVFHSGFDRAAMKEVFTEAGFDNIKDVTAAEVVKPIKGGEMRTFTIFLMTGKRR
ncbi:MAG: class I SAM-dependent methyltransferase [Deltaproteobacteria bacterium]|nr:class I SAM-dependent methyltransferase [Deltaproteobacteria bacterium]